MDKPKDRSTPSQQVEAYVKEGRDHRSYAVKEYEPYQDAEKKKHRENLNDVLEKKY